MLNNIKTIKGDRGFTIVELLIVIVVIAILASITIVAYNGIQQRAKASAAQSAAATLDKKLEIYNAENGQYANLASTITGTATQNGVATTTSSSWYTAPNTAFTLVAGTAATNGISAAIAAPSDPKTLYYSGIVAGGPTTSGGCIWWFDYSATTPTWKSMTVGAVTCPALPANAAASFTTIAL